jgi:glycosyltransferase involved in cell wall biosynthesis
LFPSHDRSAAKRVLNYASFAVAATAVGSLRMPPPDVWLVYSSPATAAVPAFLSRPRHKAPVLLVIQDLWPDSVLGSDFLSGPSKLAQLALDRVCSWTYRRATAVGVISPSMREVLVGRGVCAAKIFDTPNWVDDRHLSMGQAAQVSREALGLPPGVLFMYAGNLGELQGLEPFVAAFREAPSAQLVLIGDGVARPALEETVRRAGLRNVSFLPPQPTERIGAYLRASDVQVVSLRDTPLLRATMPSKVQSSLAAGKPVLAHAAGDVAALVDAHDVGRSARPGDHYSIVAAVRALANAAPAERVAMGHAARNLYEARFSPQAGVDRLERLLLSTSSPLRKAE